MIELNQILIKCNSVKIKHYTAIAVIHCCGAFFIMARIEKHLCDIKGCENEAKVINKTFQVVFFTDQTEGRSRKPYLSEEKLDLCGECVEKIIKERKAICGSGCMGFNDYTI